MDNTTSISHIWSNGIQNGKGYVTIKDQIDLTQERRSSRDPKRNLEASPDRVAGDEAVHALRVVIEDRSQDLDRARVDQDHDHAGQDRDRDLTVRNRNRDLMVQNRDRDLIVRGHGLENALDHAIAANQQVDPFQARKQGQDRILRRNTRTNHVADQNHAPERIALDLDENHDLGVVPSPATEIVIEVGAVRDHLPLSESHGLNHDPHHPNENHAAVLGLYQNRLIVEVALGRELLPQIMLTNKM